MAKSTPGFSERIAIISIVGAACAGTRAFGFLPSTPNGVSHHTPSWNLDGFLSTVREGVALEITEFAAGRFESMLGLGWVEVV